MLIAIRVMRDAHTAGHSGTRRIRDARASGKRVSGMARVLCPVLVGRDAKLAECQAAVTGTSSRTQLIAFATRIRSSPDARRPAFR